MKGKESYPPAEAKDSNGAADALDPSGENEDTKTSNGPDGDSEDVRGPESWDGSEAEIVVDDNAEVYEEETTGIKIKYKLKPEEIKSFINHSEGCSKNKKAQKTHTIAHLALFVLMIILGFADGSTHYFWLAVLPAVSLTLIWLMPFFSIKKLVKDVFKDEETEVEIFPERIEIKHRNYTREILLDGSCESEELDNMIMLFSDKGVSLIVPLRAVEPEFRAEVQAMIFSGAKPRYKD